MPTQIDYKTLTDDRFKRKWDQTTPPLKGMAHQEYPKTMYLWAKDKSIHPLHPNKIEKDAANNFVSVTDFERTDQVRVKVANNAEEEKALAAKGYRNEPHRHEVDEPVPAGFEPDIPEAPKQASAPEKPSKAPIKQ